MYHDKMAANLFNCTQYQTKKLNPKRRQQKKRFTAGRKLNQDGRKTKKIKREPLSEWEREEKIERERKSWKIIFLYLAL